MARLNEPPVSTDSVEVLRRKLLRQNRDLAKSNNVRALRIRELENECACMLSENLELRGRILELEKQVEDNESRRIADHALAIKDRLEAQLTEWGTLLAGLGLEPPMKRQSPRIRKTSKQRMSFHCSRASPSQRRLRDVARDIEELGHISENKSYPRMSLNPEQILALRSEAESAETLDSPELGPPPMSQFIDTEPIKVDSPCSSPIRSCEPSPRVPATLLSPKVQSTIEISYSPVKKSDPTIRQPILEPKKQAPVLQETDQAKPSVSTEPAAVPTKAGSKRKLASRDEVEVSRQHDKAKENQAPRAIAAKPSIREKAHGKTLKELSTIRKDSQDRTAPVAGRRKALAAKSTNDDVSSPRKPAKAPITDEVAVAKANLGRPKGAQEKPKPKTKTTAAIKIDKVPAPQEEPLPVTVTCELGKPIVEPALLTPSSPEPIAAVEASRGDTPPPADINSNGETSRPSRRNRTAVSYAEPNLRDKMRRPTKEMVDAVTGSRRSSHYLASSETVKTKRESEDGESWKQLPAATEPQEAEADHMPASPLAGKGKSAEELPSTVASTRRRRTASAVTRIVDSDSDSSHDDGSRDEGSSNITASESDLYEFNSLSPQPNGAKKTAGRQAKSSRRFSSTADNDEYVGPKERASSRRRSMMV